MNWVKRDSNNFPKGEVLAANFSSSSVFQGEKAVGKLHYEKETNCICCKSESKILVNPTHYILTSQIGFDIG